MSSSIDLVCTGSQNGIWLTSDLDTAAIPISRQKRLAGLPSTIDAFKKHIFNNIIWPNLSDENDGAGLVTYMRLVEGGSPAIGTGEGKGYVEVCNGLSVKVYCVSHGHCFDATHSHRGSNASLGSVSSQPAVSPYLDSINISPRSKVPPRTSLPPAGSKLSQPIFGPGAVPFGESRTADTHQKVCVYDSSAYFIRDISTGQEVLIFGDVEPDSISLSPRNIQVWKEAAGKIQMGQLKGMWQFMYSSL